MRNPNKESPLNSSIDIDIDIDMYRGEKNCMIQCNDLFLLVVVSYLRSQKTQLFSVFKRKHGGNLCSHMAQSRAINKKCTS